MGINLSLGFISYSISLGVYLVMLVLFLIGQRDSPKGKPFVILISVSVLWSALLTISQIDAVLAFDFIVVAELMRCFAWIFVLQFALGSYASKQTIFDFKNLLSPANIVIALIVSFVALFFSREIIANLNLENANFIETLLQFIFPVMGLVVVEQLYRLTPKDERWNIRILCLSAASVFLFDIFVYSNALLWNQINYDYWSARGIINVLVLPLIMLSAARNPTLAPRVFISRHIVFHSAVLTAAGFYLILISLGAYFVKQYGGEWGDLLQVAFVFAGVISLALIALSSTIRLKVKNYLITHFFSNKYDYREEWHRFSNTLLQSSDLSVNQKALMAVCQILESKGGALWLKDNEQFVYATNWHMPLNDEQKQLPESLVKETLPTQQELLLCQSIEKQEKLLSTIEDAWFLLPLWNQQQLLGVAVFKESAIERKLDDEDRELLKTVSDHIALYFSQNQSSYQLMEAQKFQHISQMTAFLVHDLKTVLSQLMLMVENAKVHRSNPAFIDDMLQTLEHVTKKMQRLIAQLKEPELKDVNEEFSFNRSIQTILDGLKHQKIELIFEPLDNDVMLKENKELFLSAIKHIIQNAIEASDKKSTVLIKIVDNLQYQIKVIDKGVGMTEEFIAERLFRAFDSSKGVSGMGVGVYQSRQYFRSIGGDITVSSRVNEGTEFILSFPKS